MARTPKPSGYAAWYAKHGADRNERRREAYASDPSVRKAAIARSRQWRAARAQGATVEREIFREVNGKRVRVWSLGQIADMVGYSSSALRFMVTEGQLPEPTLPGKHRYYLANEVKSIKAQLSKRR